MERKAYYRCGCGVSLFSDFPYLELNCSFCGEKVPRLFEVADVPSMADLSLSKGGDYNLWLLLNKHTVRYENPYSLGDFVSRPYVVGTGCDGTAARNIHFVLQRLLAFFGEDDYSSFLERAYPKNDNSCFNMDFGALEDEVLQGASVCNSTLVPYGATVQTVLDDLFSTSFWSLAEHAGNFFKVSGIHLGIRMDRLMDPVVGKGVHK